MDSSSSTTNKRMRVQEESEHRFLTKPMSVYERTNVIGMRAEQLARGSPALIPWETINNGVFDVYKVAEEELAQGKLPFIVSRTYPDSKVELYQLSGDAQ